MPRETTKRKVLGSVAVDSETGMEHYQVPKEAKLSPGSQDEPLRDDFKTPNYGEGSDGESQNLAGVPAEFMHLFEHDASEVIVYQATRHPVGVFAIFLMGGAAAVVVIIAYLFLVGDSEMLASVGTNSANVGAVGGLVVVVLMAVIAAVSFLAAYVYKKSRLILTNQKVVFIQYHSLIAREISQLNIGEVEDVNVSQPTIFDRIFKTGRITIETAGEQNNYVMNQVEKPYEFAQKTIQMHEGSIAEYGN